AEHFLRYHNYYHVSGYVFYFEIKGDKRTHRLSQPVSFNEIMDLFCFDKKLRESFFSISSEIEIAFRCSMAYRLSMAYGPFCFENVSILRKPYMMALFKEKLEKALESHKNEPFVAHHTNTYQEPILPAWVMIELLTMGNISWLYSQLRTDLQKKIASDFSVDHIVLVSWLKALTELRNTCAHHMRLWNKVFVNYPKIRKADKSFPVIPGMESRLASFLPMIFHLLSIIQKDSVSKTEIISFLTSMPLIHPKDMGLQSWPKTGTLL
ncbi:MAG: Abi family protein, partial [Tissierellales bacterium]|nr:Abi family protein [Tissierellales bacterium]